ncbi:MAG TPA: hypothetical protein PKW90_27095 [Myxococcota bacterium]|nr:hypothetical protein [Myxococcota bacterium]
MSPELLITLYASLGLAWTGLRLGRGEEAGNALFAGLFWPLDLPRRWIELMARGLVGAEAEGA